MRSVWRNRPSSYGRATTSRRFHAAKVWHFQVNTSRNFRLGSLQLCCVLGAYMCWIKLGIKHLECSAGSDNFQFMDSPKYGLDDYIWPRFVAFSHFISQNAAGFFTERSL